MALAQADRLIRKRRHSLPAMPSAFTQMGDDDDLFSVIKRQDVLLHHPFESFQPVVDFLRKAASDPPSAGDQDGVVPGRPELSSG